MKNKHSNTLRAMRFERPDHIPMTFAVNDSYWNACPQERLVELMAAHPLLFPGFVPPKLPFTPKYANVARRDAPYTDDFGCTWVTALDGLTGTVTGHPLADWAAFAQYQAPDPARCMGIGPIDWAAEAARIQARHQAGRPVQAGLRHGHTFLQLCDLRGYANLMFDMADEEPRLYALIELVEAFNQGIVDRYLALGVDVFGYAEDLGMQQGPMLSPAHFRKYIQPSYRRLMKKAVDQDVMVHLHSDGDIRTLADDLVQSGVQVLNLQDLVNGLDWIAARFKDKLCIELDLDRQEITPHGTPAQIDALVREEVEKLGSPQGGLMMIYGLYPGVPIENAGAVMDAMEKYAFYFD